ncbi:MAG TPA: DUF3108 domain-containing protein [Gemmatimonadales bacterium]|jgi:hypothetical protein
MVSLVPQVIAALALSASHLPAPQLHPPFAVGETLEFSGSKRLLISIRANHAFTFTVAAIDTIDGTPYWRFTLNTTISVPLYHDHSTQTSWTRVSDFVSHRYVHNADQTGWSRHDDFRIYPDSGFYRNMRDNQTQRTPEKPIDDVAFFYFLRLPSVPLEVGKTYQYTNYFKADRNPVTVTVLRHELCDLPDNVRAQCLVLHPVVEDPPHGLFMKDNEALIWLTDDGRRLPAKVKSGGYTLTLQKIIEPR